MNNKWLNGLIVAAVFFAVPALALDQDSIGDDNSSLIGDNPDETVDAIDSHADDFATDSAAAEEIQDNTALVDGVKTVDEIDKD